MGNWWSLGGRNEPAASTAVDEGAAASSAPTPAAVAITRIGCMYKSWDAAAVRTLTARRVIGRAARRGAHTTAVNATGLPVVYAPCVVEALTLAGYARVSPWAATSPDGAPLPPELTRAPLPPPSAALAGDAAPRAACGGGCVGAHAASKGAAIADTQNARGACSGGTPDTVFRRKRARRGGPAGGEGGEVAAAAVGRGRRRGGEEEEEDVEVEVEGDNEGGNGGFDFPLAKRPRLMSGDSGGCGVHATALSTAISDAGLVAAYFLSLGYWPTDGLKFGAHLALYDAHPDTCHAAYLVIVLRHLPRERDAMGWVRLAQTVHKALVLCALVDGGGSGTEDEGRPPTVEADPVMQTALMGVLRARGQRLECAVITYERGIA